jgi:hypothetical protein
MCASSLLQRLLLVSGDLSVLASIDASCGSVGLSHGITSLLWVGPALLYMTAAGQVRGGLQYIEVQSSHSAIQYCTVLLCCSTAQVLGPSFNPSTSKQAKGASWCQQGEQRHGGDCPAVKIATCSNLSPVRPSPPPLGLEADATPNVAAGHGAEAGTRPFLDLTVLSRTGQGSCKGWWGRAWCWPCVSLQCLSWSTTGCNRETFSCPWIAYAQLLQSWHHGIA